MGNYLPARAFEPVFLFLGDFFEFLLFLEALPFWQQRIFLQFCLIFDFDWTAGASSVLAVEAFLMMEALLLGFLATTPLLPLSLALFKELEGEGLAFTFWD